MHDLAKLFVDRITSGLQRKSLTTCSKWAEKYRVLGNPYPGPWTFKYHPWLKEMHDSRAEFNIGQKAAQMGYTEWALNTAFYTIDIKQVDVLYVLPALKPDASDFSSARFDTALELSPYLERIFSDVKNVGHKRAGNTNMYIRGSRSRAGLKSIPTGLVIMDELDEMNQKNILLAQERTAGQINKLILMLSTPTFEDTGINHYYKNSTKEHFFFKCPSCDRLIELTFPESIKITGETINDASLVDSYLQCHLCKYHLPHTTKPEWLSTGRWVPEHSKRERRGFNISQMYSSTIAPEKFAISYLLSQNSPTDEQEFFNSKLGRTHTVADARITDQDINNCRGSYKNGTLPKRDTLVTMGIDVGKWLHLTISEWYLNQLANPTFDINTNAYRKILLIHKLVHFEELDSFMINYGVNSAVIDAHPERRKAYEFATRFWGIVKLCFYARDISGKVIHEGKMEEATISVDRTAWLDMTLGRYRKQTVNLPIDIPIEYATHLKSLIRYYDKDSLGNPIGRYITAGSSEDHYAHADNYGEIALLLASKYSASASMSRIV